jgi:hypothetical protein
MMKVRLQHSIKRKKRLSLYFNVGDALDNKTYTVIAPMRRRSFEGHRTLTHVKLLTRS